MKVDLNLDEPKAAEKFVTKHGTRKGRTLARALGLSGKGSEAAATALSNYAWNKKTAEALREKGEIRTAEIYEDICDRIYKEDIAGKIECW